MPCHENSLPGIARNCKTHRFSHPGLIFRQRWVWLPIPRIEPTGGPRERTVEVAQVARVGAARGGKIGDPRTADLMTANGGQHSVGGVRHVTVVAEIAGGVGGVVRMRCDLGNVLEARMALNARTIIRAHFRKLIVGFTFVKRVTRKAGEPASPITGGFDQPIVLPTAHPNHAIGPKEIAEDLWIIRQNLV